MKETSVLGQAVLFEGDDASGRFGLWESNGTAAGTYELTGISGAFSAGIFSTVDIPPFATFDGEDFNSEVLFAGKDASGNAGLWVTNGTAAGTHELTGIRGASSGGDQSPNFMTVFNGEVLFDGVDENGNRDLWVTNGKAAGTSELTGISGGFRADCLPISSAILASSTAI
jgi:ELWxxDGT repeat protein